MAAGTRPRAPVRVQTRHQALAPPWPAFQAIIYQHPGVRHSAANRLGDRQPALLLMQEKPPPKSSQGIIPTTFSSTAKSNGVYCSLRSLQAQGVLAVTSGGLRSCLQFAARYRMLSAPLKRAGGCFLPCLLGRISSHSKPASLPLFPQIPGLTREQRG